MQLFKFSFEESEYIVDETFVKRSMEKSNNKRFLGILLINLLIYGFIVLTPIMVEIFIEGNTEISSISWQWGSLILLLLFYLIYFGLSVKYNKRNVTKKYLTNLYLTILFFILMLIFPIFTAIMLSSTSKIIAILSLLVMVAIIWYTLPRLVKGINNSVSTKETFNSLAYLMSEKVGNLLMIMGTSGVAAGAAIVNIISDGTSNRIIDAIIFPFMPTAGYLVLYFIFIEFYKGYYVVKYFEQYRVKFGYSIEEWYGKNSKEYKESLKKG